MATKKNEIMVSVRIPRDSNKSTRQFVSVNERTWLIERGKTVKIPLCAWEVLRNSEIAEDAQISYLESAPGNVSAPGDVTT